ncbi:MAG: hypothetical protein HY854_01090 [Burkholderiales bacterium]|nr:hypothetical protein [Burkholderiales bacterium]
MATFYGTSGSDNISGSVGSDSIFGYEGDDNLLGNSGHDLIEGGAGNDVMTGGDGNDTLDGGAGVDLMLGGNGADTYYVDSIADRALDTGSGLGDIVIAASSFVIESGIESLVLIGSGNTYGFGNASANAITGNGGNNVLDGAAGNDSLYGGAGNDMLKGGAGADALYGGDGNDKYRWKVLTESNTTLMDTVYGFAAGDKLDVSAIDASTASGRQSFTFITGTTFTAAGQLRFDAATNRLLGNTDTNLTTIEFAVRLDGITSLTSSALILTDTLPAAFLSPGLANIAENSGSGRVVYQAVVDDGPVTFSLIPTDDYASFSIHSASGVVTLLDNPDQEANPTYTFTVLATDQVGLTSQIKVVLVVGDVDEVAPTITSESPAEAAENSANVYQASADDSGDYSAGVTWTITGTDASLLAIGSTTGAVTLNAGTLDFEGSKTTYTFTVVASDGVNAPVSKDVTVNVTNVNEAPLISVGEDDDASATIDETDEGLSAGGTLTVVDPDVADAVTASVQGVSVSGSGSTSLTSDQLLAMLSVTPGSIAANAGDSSNLGWDFDSGEEAFDGLAPGEDLVLTYTIRVTDGGSLTDEQTVTVTINGTEESPPPVISEGASDSDTFTVTEDWGGPPQGGTLTVVDPVTSDTVDVDFTVVLAGSSIYDSADFAVLFDLTPDTLAADPGSSNNLGWTFSGYDLDLDDLGVGESLVVTYTIRAEDNGGRSDTHEVVITYTGVNDPVVLSGSSDFFSYTQDGTTQPSGSVGFTDLDAHDTHTVASIELAAFSMNASPMNVSSAPDIGTFDAWITASGDAVAWSFDVGSIDWLGAGETIYFKYEFLVDDGNGGGDNLDVILYFNGVNDAPVISVQPGDEDAGSLTEDGASASGTLTIRDIDLSDAATLSITDIDVTGAVGIGTSSFTGTLQFVSSVLDADTSDTGNIQWSFEPGLLQFDFLGEDETMVVTFSVAGEDTSGSMDTHDIVVTVFGVNDDVSFGTGEFSGYYTEPDVIPFAVVAEITGDIQVLDADVNDSHYAYYGFAGGDVSESAAADIGTFSASVLGSQVFWQFDVMDIDFMALGENLTLSYDLTVTDGYTGQASTTIIVYLYGANDLPTLTAITGDSDSASVTEEETSSETGSLTVRDVDLSDKVTAGVVSVTLAGTFGSLTGGEVIGLMTVTTGFIDADTDDSGNLDWTFDPTGDGFDFLAAGESLVLNYSIAVSDSHGGEDTHAVAITVTGVNDAPDITVDATGTPDDIGEDLLENPSLEANGTLTVVDPDDSDTVAITRSVATSGTTTGLTASNAALQAMLTVNGPLDADSGDTHNLAWSFSGTESAFDYLDEGETLVLTYTITATDGSLASDDQSVTITVTGTNDGPDISVDGTAGDSASASVTEGSGALTEGGTLTVIDPDRSDSVTMSVEAVELGGVTTGASSNATYKAMLGGSGSANADAGDSANVEWTFTGAEADFDYLDEDETLTLTYTVRATDDSSAMDEQAITVTVNGANDTAAWSLQTGDLDTGSVTESGATDLTTNDTLTIRDPDLSDAVTITVEGVVASGTTAGLGSGEAALLAMMTATTGSIDADSDDVNNVAWTFDSGAEMFSYLTTGQSLVLTYTLRATDDSGMATDTTVTITVDGVSGENTAPTLDDTESPALSAVSETTGDESPAAPTGAVGDLVSSLLGGADDVDGDTLGMAITAFDASSQGKLWYSINGGTNWFEITSATAASAVLLSGTARIIFKPNGGEAGTIATVFTFKAWDQTEGTNGGTGDTTTGTAFSTDTDTVAVTLTAAGGGTGSFAAPATYYGGSGDDAITVTGDDLEDSTIVLGGGNDTLTFDFPGLISGGTTVLDGGSGNDTIALTGHDGTLDLTGITITGFEGLTGSVQEQAFVHVNASLINSLTTINLGSQSDALELHGGGTFNFAGLTLTGVESITVGDSTNTTINMTAAQVLSVTSLLSGGGGTDTLNVTTDITNSATLDKVTGFEVINLNGTGAETIVAVNAMVASGTTTTISNAGGGALAFNGKAEADGKFVINMGAGGGTVVSGLGLDTLNGGAGVDKFSIGQDNYTSAAARDIITGFTAGSSGDVFNVEDGTTSGSAGISLSGSNNFAGATSLQTHSAAGNLTIADATEVIIVSTTTVPGNLSTSTAAGDLNGTNLLTAIGGTITTDDNGNQHLFAVADASGNVGIYYGDAGTGGSPGGGTGIAASELVLVAVLVGVTIGNLVYQNFGNDNLI